MKDFLRQIPKLCAPSKKKKKMLPQIAGFQSGVLHFRRYLDWFWLNSVEHWHQWRCGQPGTRLWALCSPNLGFFGRQLPSPDPQELRGPGAILGIPRNAHPFLGRSRQDDQLFGCLRQKAFLHMQEKWEGGGGKRVKISNVSEPPGM